jgi:O-antigen/teichoic acid export membrane protein
VFLCAVLNLALNGVWVPAFGIRGAAMATLVAHAALLAWMMRTGSQQLPVPMPWGVAGRASVAAAVMFAVVTPLHLAGGLGTVAIRVAAGAPTYLALILLLDRTAREGLAALMVRAKNSPR